MVYFEAPDDLILRAPNDRSQTLERCTASGWVPALYRRQDLELWKPLSRAEVVARIQDQFDLSRAQAAALVR